MPESPWHTSYSWPRLLHMQRMHVVPLQITLDVIQSHIHGLGADGGEVACGELIRVHTYAWASRLPADVTHAHSCDPASSLDACTYKDIHPNVLWAAAGAQADKDYTHKQPGCAGGLPWRAVRCLWPMISSSRVRTRLHSRWGRDACVLRLTRCQLLPRWDVASYASSLHAFWCRGVHYSL